MSKARRQESNVKCQMPHKGFTLIELLIVIAIIAVLAAAVIIVVSPGERMLDAREATREAHMISIGTAIHLAVVDCADADNCGNVELVLKQTDCDATDGSPTIDFDDDCAEVVGLAEAPVDPLGGYYKVEKDGTYRVKVWTTETESQWNSEANAKTF